MSDWPDYLPCCYRNLTVLPGESLGSYLLRVAEGNGYKGIADLLRMLSIQLQGQIADVLLKIRVDARVLVEIGRMTVGDGSHLCGFTAEALPPAPDPLEAIFFEECRIDVDALVLAVSAVCPCCLATDGYARAEWELAPVTACTKHGVLLRDTCDACGEPLSWKRPSLLMCGHCGSDLASQRTQSVADPSVIDTIRDFAALAPFRVRGGGEATVTVFWDEMFRVFKTILLPDADLALGQWPKRLARSVRIEQRHRAVEALSRTRDSHAYDLRLLQWKIQRALAALQALPRPYVIEQYARRFLQGEVGLSGESATAISGADAVLTAPEAYQRLSPWPPTLGCIADVARFLGVSIATVDALMRVGRLPAAGTDHDGFDADHVLAAGTYLGELLDLPALGALAGISITSRDLAAYGLLPRWNGLDREDHRVDFDRVFEIQQRLLAQWHVATRPESAASLGELLNDREQPSASLIDLLRRILCGQLTRFDWVPPFTWTSLKVDPRDCDWERQRA